MAFTVEDGSGDNEANAYITVEFFRDHHEDRGRATDDYVDGAVQSAIVKATDYVDQRFGTRYRGERKTLDQALEWPRIDAIDNDGYELGTDRIPRKLKMGVAEYALIVLGLTGGELLPNPAPPFATVDEDGNVTGGASGQAIRVREKVGPLEEEVYYARATNTGKNVASKSDLVADLHIPEYPRADLWIQELLRNSLNRRMARGD